MPVRPLFNIQAETDVPEAGRQLSCVSCGLYKDVLSSRMRPHGENQRRIMILGEGPGESEDRVGKPWQGPAGRVLRSALAERGIDLDRDCVSLNAVACRPPKNREPTSYEVACCRKVIVNPAIAEHRPDVILLMGKAALASVLGPLCSYALGEAVGKWRGFTIPVPELRAWVCPTYHPSYVMREEKRIEIDTVWRQDVRRALSLLGTPVPQPEDLRAKIDLPRTEAEVLRALDAAHEAAYVSFDYETTGLRAVLHEVICASFATSPDRATAFMMPKTGPIPDAWAKLLVDGRSGKISHNMKFENEWSRRHYGVDSIKWIWDSMIAAHVVDNRVGICGLDRQAFLNFGIRDWSDLIEPYKKAIDSKDLASHNRLREFVDKYGEDELLVYCGIDGLTAFRLAMRQMVTISA